MLKQPRSQYVCCYFWENATLLLVLFAARIVVLLAGALAAAYAGVAGITCVNEKRKMQSLEFSRF